jgi:transposase-like protein
MGMRQSHRALRLLRQENPEWRSVVVRSNRYLNNIVEQDHRAIMRRCAPMLALKSFRTAAVTLAGVELAHRIRKRQFSFGRRGSRRFLSLKHLWARALADAETDRGNPAVVALSRYGTRTQVLAC